MTIIEHSILIPTAVENVWQFISNIENNALWLADCRGVAFITSYKQGRGARWRHTNENGRDYVIEITDWYERVGYRYKIVDGAPYTANFGVIRLQETPEGTIVQWTFEYALTGFLSGVRNAMSVKRGVEGNIIHSLQTLYKQVNKSKTMTTFAPKSLMQDAPDAEARAQYKPRYPSSFAEKPVNQPLIEISEPPISEDDTKQNKIITSVTDAIVSQVSDDDIFASLPPLEFNMVAQQGDTNTIIEQGTQEENQFELPLLSEDKDTPPLTDSGRLSVFEIFGVPKPSETQQMKAVAATNIHVPTETPISASYNKVNPTDESANRQGKRAEIRRKTVKIRRTS